MSGASSLARAARWLLDSGIQEPSGGVARFYRSEIGRNKPVSAEITGYAASALVYLFQTTGDEEFLERARKTARFLTDRAWDPVLSTFPFEYPSPSQESRHHAYFFDCGIIVRGLLAVWRHTHEQRLLDIARTAAHGMVADFRSGGDYHPIIGLPSKEPLPRTEQWSRAPGCWLSGGIRMNNSYWTSRERQRMAWSPISGAAETIIRLSVYRRRNRCPARSNGRARRVAIS